MNKKICRYNPSENPETCKGCEKGCLGKRPGMYINREFEDAVKEMESNGSQRNKTIQGETAPL